MKEATSPIGEDLFNRGQGRLQLGKDFILSADGHLLYAHRSNDPADRPAAIDLANQFQHLTRRSPADET